MLRSLRYRLTAETQRTQRSRREKLLMYPRPKRISVNETTREIIAAAIAVHRALGPGLLESAYEECLCQELALRGIPFERQVPLPLEYRARHSARVRISFRHPGCRCSRRRSEVHRGYCSNSRGSVANILKTRCLASWIAYELQCRCVEEWD